jgi:hypothetical protein
MKGTLDAALQTCAWAALAAIRSGETWAEHLQAELPGLLTIFLFLGSFKLYFFFHCTVPSLFGTSL